MTTVVKETVSVLRSGGIVLYPTDTVWGLGCDATNEEAVQRLIRLKHRAQGKSMLVLLDSDAKLPSYVQEVPSIAYDLIDAAIRPLTLIYPGARNLAPSLIAPDGSIGIRITREKISQAICQQLRVPIVSTSANISGNQTPRFFSEIDPEVVTAVDYVVPLRQDDRTSALPSEIIKLGVHNEVTLIRV
ncbi:MAG: L-threonylcarbamoyladenylate synthase [Porphyromonas sp.]|nr:L-threonylcarbamoyladenylate synthase [Porphyromonas sp.]